MEAYPESLEVYATLLAHLKYFPKEQHTEVLRRLDFEPVDWRGYAERCEARLTEALQEEQDLSAFHRALSETRQLLRTRNARVESLPLDRASAYEEASAARSLRLRDLDPVQYLEILSSRLPRIQVVPRGNDGPSRVAPRSELRKAGGPLPPPRVSNPEVRAGAPEPESAKERALRLSREARQRLESTQQSPSVEPPPPVDARLNVTIQVSENAFSEPSEQRASSSPEHTLQVDEVEVEFPEETGGLSLFEFANLCAEYNQCPPSAQAQVREKYGLGGEQERLQLLDGWRMRLVRNEAELAEWRSLYEAATRHWKQIYRGKA